MKKVMLLAAVVAMVLAAAVPAFAQNTGQVNDADVACVQTALQGDVAQAAAGGQYDGDASNVNIQTIAQECNIAVSQVNSVVNDVTKVDDHGKKFFVDDHGKKVVVVDHGKKVVVHKASASATASATAKASAPAVVEYEYKASAPAAVEYEYKATATATASAAPAAELPETGGSSLIALGAGVLLVAGGLLARRIVR
ncbi:MAG TPA: LPXTG cell wall anchor domain-containing protein [Rubrobacter sp.]|nr:LPXTG cell wall anchor domain-containing protein [Rubrobacter sp.]